MNITHQGAPMFEILLPSNPSTAEWFAGDELRRYLLSMIGLPPIEHYTPPLGMTKVEICINCREREKAAGLNVACLAPDAESFYWAPVDNTFFIMGGGIRGTLYAVYELLDYLGCRWFTPQLTHIPRHQNLTLPSEAKSGCPAFEYRDILTQECADPLWALRNRLNGTFQTIPEHLGGIFKFARHAHSLFEFVSPQKYFAKHPEYYSEINGIRQHVAAQVCLTNPDVLKIATESILQLMRKMPNAKLISVSQMDWNGWCECAECLKAVEETGSQSGLYLRFVNAIAERTVQEFPDKFIQTLAYSYTEPAPRERITLHPNVRIQMCPIHTCQIHPFERCSGLQDVAFLENFRGWTELTDQLYIWHYATDFSHYYMPLPNMRQLTENISFYKKHGVCGLFVQANGGSELSTLKGYLLARLMWNPNTLLETVLDEFLPAVYGKGAAEVREYIDLIHTAAKTETHHLGCYEPPNHPFYTDALLAGALTHLQCAEKAARGDARKRVRRLRHGVDLAQLYRKYIHREFHRDGKVFHNSYDLADRHLFHAIIKEREQAGHIQLSESNSLAVSAQRYGLWFERHKLIELKAGRQRLFVAPSLGGRILEWYIDEQQLLEPPDVNNRHLQYPMSEGNCDMVIQPPYGYSGYGETFTVDKRSCKTVKLSATIGGGLKLERYIRLTADCLQIRSTLTNVSDKPIARQWGGALHFRLANWTKLSIETHIRHPFTPNFL